MYEIWLAMNIVWEIALTIWPWIAAALLLWIVLLAAAARRSAPSWRGAFRPALLAGALVALLAFFALPGLTRSSLGDLDYWVDWANVLAIAAGIGAAAWLMAWPALTWLRKPGR